MLPTTLAFRFYHHYFYYYKESYWHLVFDPPETIAKYLKQFSFFFAKTNLLGRTIFSPNSVSNKRAKWACSLSFGALWISQLVFRFRPPRSAERALTRQSLAPLVSGEGRVGREVGISPNLWAENVTGAAVNADTSAGQTRTLPRDEAGPTPPPVLFLDGVDVGWPAGSLDAGEAPQGANLRVLPPRSHTHTHTLGWEMCVGRASRVSNRNLIHCVGGVKEKILQDLRQLEKKKSHNR